MNENWELYLNKEALITHGFEHLHIPTPDYTGSPSIEDITTGVNFIKDRVDRQETCYVHCKAGKGRSVLLVLCYLIQFRSMDEQHAFEFVREKRPQINLSQPQWAALQEFGLCLKQNDN